MAATPLVRVLAVSIVALVAACGGAKENDDDLVVSETDSTSSALSSSPDPSSGDGDDDANDPEAREKGSHGCKEHDDGKHRHHRHHRFKVLDALDGKRDGHITIADLPAGLPDRLLARLHKIDANGDGAVSWNEVVAWRKEHDRH